MNPTNNKNYNNEKAYRKGKGKRGESNNYSGHDFNSSNSNQTSSKNMEHNFNTRETSEAVQNVRYESQSEFFETFGYKNRYDDNSQKSNKIYPPLTQYENVFPMETNEADESVGAQVPIPAPRQMVKKKNQKENTSVTNEVPNDGNRGSKQKSKGKKDADNSPVMVCITCEKAVTQKNIHNGHHIAPFQNGMEQLQEKELNKLSATVKEAKNLMKSEMQIKDMTNLWDSGIDESLQNVFKKYGKSSSQNTDKFLKVIDEGNKIINNAQQTKISTLMELIDLRTCSVPVISEAQQPSSLQDKPPLWLLVNWFKATLGLLIQSGKNIVAFSQMNSGSQFAPFELQGDRLLLYSFRPNFKPEDDTLVVPFDSVNCLFECNDFYAFLKISYNNKPKGCLFMRLNKETFWGNQFMSLCSGEYGPSFRNTRFFRSCWKGKPGHHVWGGDYTRGDGSGGERFFKWNRALVNSPQPIIKGLIASRPGVEDRSSIFRIYLKGSDPKMRKSNDIELNDKFGFGQVIDGLDVLEHVSDLPDISKSKIEDAGRFFVLT